MQSLLYADNKCYKFGSSLTGLRDDRQVVFSGQSMKCLSFFVSLLLLVACSEAPKPSAIEPSAIAPQQAPSVTALSQKAGQLTNGMTFKQVVASLGKSPDTVSQIQGLLHYEWSNTKDCHPVSVNFKEQGGQRLLNGVDEGRTCVKGSSYNKPDGKTCQKNALCKP